MYKLRLKTAEEDYDTDHLGRRYRYTSLPEYSEYDEFVAVSKILIPRYLICYKTSKTMLAMAVSFDFGGI